MKKIINFIERNKYIDILIIIIYIVLVSFIAIKHELSQDEIQSFLIARDLSYIDIIKQMKYEGHSFFWHYLISPLAKLGFAASYQKIIPVISSSIAIIILWLKAPLKKYLKLITTFSYGMLYWYGCFARPYCLIPLLLFLIASIYKDRYKHPYKYSILLGLLANTHLIMLPVVFLLSIDYYYNTIINKKNNSFEGKNKNYILSLIILLLLSSVVITAAIVGYLNCKIVKDYSYVKDTINYILMNIKVSAYKTVYQLTGNENIKITTIIIIIISFIFLILGSIKNIKNSIILISEILFIFLIHALFWFAIPTRVFIPIYLLIFLIWIGEYEKKSKSNKYWIIAFIIINIITYKGMFISITEDINKSYTSGKPTANYIINNIEENSVFIYCINDLQQLIIGYLPKDKYKFFSLSENDYVTYSTWSDNLHFVISKKDILFIQMSIEKKFKGVYLIVEKNYRYPKYFNEHPEYFKAEKLYTVPKKDLIKTDILRDNKTEFSIYKLTIKNHDEDEFKEFVRNWQ